MDDLALATPAPSSTATSTTGPKDSAFDSERREKRFRTRHRLRATRLFVWCLFLLLLTGGPYWALEEPFVHGILVGAGCAIGGLGAFVRVWSLSHIAGRKRIELVTTGPYSLCRNPLYFSSALLAVGLMLSSGSLLLTLTAVLAFAALYPSVLRKEARELAALHGESYSTYCAGTPAFWPRRSGYREEETTSICPAAFRRGAWSVALFAMMVGLLQLVASLHREGVLPTFFTLY